MTTFRTLGQPYAKPFYNEESEQYENVPPAMDYARWNRVMDMLAERELLTRTSNGAIYDRTDPLLILSELIAMIARGETDEGALPGVTA